MGPSVPLLVTKNLTKLLLICLTQLLKHVTMVTERLTSTRQTWMPPKLRWTNHSMKTTSSHPVFELADLSAVMLFHHGALVPNVVKLKNYLAKLFQNLMVNSRANITPLQP